MGVFSADNGGVVGISPWLTKWKRLVCGLKEDDKRIRDELHDLIDNKGWWGMGKRKGQASQWQDLCSGQWNQENCNKVLQWNSFFDFLPKVKNFTSECWTGQITCLFSSWI